MITASRKKELCASLKQLMAEFDKDAETPIVENEETAQDFDLKDGENVFAKEMEEACKTASTVEKGIEDEINDTDAGGDATVQTITEGGADAKGDVESDKEVFPTKCDEVADKVQKVNPIKSKIAKLVEFADVVAAELEECGDLNGAVEIDNFSDKMENNYLK